MKRILILAAAVLLVAIGILGLGFQNNESEGGRKEEYGSSQENIEIKEDQLESYQTFIGVMDDIMEERLERAADDSGMTVQEFKEFINKED